MFQQEVLAEFIDSSSVFNNISNCLILPDDLTPISDQSYYGGLDIGLVNDSSVLCIIDANGNLVKYYRWEKIDSPDLINEVVRVSNEWKITKTFVEVNGMGLPITQDLKLKLDSIEAFTTSAKSKSEIISSLIHKFNTNTIKLVNDDLLRIELDAFVFTQKNGRIKYEAASGFHDDIVMSLCIALECYETYKDQEYDPYFNQLHRLNAKENPWGNIPGII